MSKVDDNKKIDDNKTPEDKIQSQGSPQGSPERPYLQVALDMVNLHRALQIAAESVEGGADWLEAGTPLIKSEGMEALRALKKSFPAHTIVADMKTIDVGGYEVEIASKAGADVVVVLGLSDDSTITEAVKAARQYGSKIMVDLMGVEDKPGRAKEVQDLGAAYICLHVGIDEQMVGRTPLEFVEKVVEAVDIPVAIAGGINSETAPDVANAGASVIIVGGAIIKAQNVADAANTVLKSILERRKIRTELFKKYKENELFEAFGKVSTPNISDALHRKGAMKGIVPRINPGTKLVGRALTVQTVDGDWAKPVEAIDKAGKGTVIVIDASGGTTAVWGELASWSCKTKGIAGVVIDGCARDIDAILDMDFPLFSRNAAPNAGEPKGHGEIGGEIICGGQTVRTGDWIIGDESGVVAVPQESAVEIANRSLDVLERENRLREEIKRGSTLSSALKLEKWEKVG